MRRLVTVHHHTVPVASTTTVPSSSSALLAAVGDCCITRRSCATSSNHGSDPSSSASTSLASASPSRPLGTGRSTQLFGEGGGDDDVSLSGMRNAGSWLDDMKRSRRDAKRGVTHTPNHHRGGAYYSATSTSAPQSASAASSFGASSYEGGSSSFTAGLGTAIPINFERKTRSGELTDGQHYAHLRRMKRSKYDEGQRIHAMSASMPKHAVDKHDPVMDRGVSLENQLLSAEVEAEYAHSKAAIEQLAGGSSSDIKALLDRSSKAWEALTAPDDAAAAAYLLEDGVEGGEGELLEGEHQQGGKSYGDDAEFDDEGLGMDGEEAVVDFEVPSPQQPPPPRQKVLLAPFGETMVPSNMRGYSDRQGEYAFMTQHKMVNSPTYEAVALSPIALQSQRTERAMLDVTMSPMPLLEKRRVLGQLAEGAFKHHLMLRASTVETVVGSLAQTTRADRVVALQAMAALPANSTAASISIDGFSTNSHAVINPRRLTYAQRKMAIPNPSHNLILGLYFHLKGTHAAPTAATIESVMRVLSQSVAALPAGGLQGGGAVASISGGNGDGVSLESGGGGGASSSKLSSGARAGKLSKEAYDLYNTAHRLMLDCDKYFVLPTRTTLSHYFTLCAHFNDMDTAVRRLVDVQESLAIVPNATMMETVIRGLTKCGLIDEAVALIGRIDSIHMSLSLFNATLEALLLSRDAKGCFAAYSAIQNVHGARSKLVIPNADTYSLLLLACEKLDDWSLAPILLRHMQQHRVRGDANCLNLMLKGLLKNGLDAFAVQLHQTMLFKKVLVWPSLHGAVKEIKMDLRRGDAEALAAAAEEEAMLSGVRDGDGDDGDSADASVTTSADADAQLLASISSKGFSEMMDRLRGAEAAEEEAAEEAEIRKMELEEEAEEAANAEDADGAFDFISEANLKKIGGVDRRLIDAIEGSGEASTGRAASGDVLLEAFGGRMVHDADEDFTTSLNGPRDVVAPSPKGRGRDTAAAKASSVSRNATMGIASADDGSLDLTHAFGDLDGGLASDAGDSAKVVVPNSTSTLGAMKRGSSIKGLPPSGKAHAAADADTDLSADSVTAADFWDIDDEGNLSALGIDEDGHGGGKRRKNSKAAKNRGADADAEADQQQQEGAHGGVSSPSASDAPSKPRAPMTVSATFAAIRRKHPRGHFVIPRTTRELEELLRRRRGSTIDPEYMLNFLEAKGVRLSHDQKRSPTTLLRKVHKQVFGTTGIQHSAGWEAELPSSSSLSSRFSPRASRSQMEGIAKRMFDSR